MPAAPSRAVITVTTEYLEAEFAKGHEYPSFDVCCALGYKLSRTSFGKVRRLWRASKGLPPEPPRRKRIADYEETMAELEGVDDIEERAQIVRRKSMELRRGAYEVRAK